jgi:phosphohistidine phosphatase
MNIIFFHTGETEVKGKKHGEVCIALSKNGEKMVTDAAQGLDRLIPRKLKVQVWSSMAPAASQTAELVAEELGVKRKLLKTLDSDDLDTLLKTAFEYGKDECLVFVSQQPHLGDWARKLTGLRLPFTEAAAAALSIDPEVPNRADLLWFIRPKFLKRIG